jgi:hypothetical protein
VVIEKWTPARIQVLTTAWLSNAESIRASSTPVTPAARAVLIASATKLAAPLAEPALSRRSRVPAITGAAIGVDSVASRGCNPRTRV